MPVQLQSPTPRATHHAPEVVQSELSSRGAGKTAGRASAKKAEELLAAIRQRVGANKYDMWFVHTAVYVNGSHVKLTCDSQFVANWIEAKLINDIRVVTKEVLGAEYDVALQVAAANATMPAAPPSNGDDISRPGMPAATPVLAPTSRTPRLSLRRLSEFVVGPSNKLAHSAACRLAEEQDARTISPLFIHGECGVGKTHLLQGICQRYIELTGRSAHVRYVTGEQFTNEYINAIRNNTIDAFRNRIRKLDLLAIDDVHFLSNKVKTQQEFLHTLDAIDLSGARVVLASDNHPHHIKRFNQALVSRFMSGMVVKVDRPDRATRVELIHRLATSRGLRINSAAVELIADQCFGSVRELEGAITKLAAYRSLLHAGDSRKSLDLRTGSAVLAPADATAASSANSVNGHDGEIGVVLTEQLFREQPWQPTHTVRLTALIESVCQRLSVNRADVLGSGRHRRVVLARGLVAYLARELTTHSFPEIAQALGRSNHSTIHTADQRLRKQLASGEPLELGGTEPAISLKELIDQLRRTLVERRS